VLRFFNILLVFTLSICSLKAQDLQLVLPLGHQDKLSIMTLSHNEEFLITGSADKTLKLWDVRSGLLIQTYYGHNTGVKSAIFTLDDKSLISGSTDGQLIVWNLESAEIIAMFPGASSEVESISLSADGSAACISFQSGKIEVRSTSDWTKISEREEKLLKGEASLLNDNTTLIYNSFSKIKKWNIRKSEIWALSESSNYYYVEKDADILSVDNNDMRVEDLQTWGSRVLHRSTTDSEQWIVMRDTQKLEILFQIKIKSVEDALLLFCNNGQHFCVISKGKDRWELKFYNSLNGEIIKEEYLNLDVLHGVLSFAQLSLDSRNIFLASDQEVIRVDLEFQSNKTEYKGAAIALGSATYHTESKSIETNDARWQLESFIQPLSEKLQTDNIEEAISSFPGLDLGNPTAVCMSADKRLIAAGYFNKSIKLFDAQSKQLLKRLWGHADGIAHLAFSADNQYLISSAKALDKNIIVWDLSTYKLVGKYLGHSASSISISAIPKSSIMMTSAEDRSIQFWDLKNMETLLTLIRLGDQEWAMVLPDKYYACSPGAALKISYRKGLQVYPFDQFDMVYNRPDKVLKALAKITGDDKSILQARYKLAWEKRMKKMGLDPSVNIELLTVPECYLTNTEIPLRTTSNQITLELFGQDSFYALNRMHIWLNGVPIYGTMGIPIKNNQKEFDSSFSIILSAGLNKISYSVVNSNGSESLHTPIYLFYECNTPPQAVTYFVGFGIDEFKESSYNLSYSVKDIKDLAIDIKKRSSNPVIIDTFFNRNLSLEKMLEVKQKLMQTEVYDKVIICYSGHGLLNDSLDYYLSTYEVDFHSPDSEGIPYAVLENLLDGIPARQKLMLIDACHSGEVDKEEKLRIQRISLEAGVEGQLASKGVFVEEAGPTDGLDYESAFELMQQMFAGIQKGSGSTIISAAGGDQYALEGGGIKNGFFTYAILSYMDTHDEVSISELKSFVNTEVPRLSKGLQQPTSRLENYSLDWNLY
jgi:WD40 repeat protein